MATPATPATLHAYTTATPIGDFTILCSADGVAWASGFASSEHVCARAGFAKSELVVGGSAHICAQAVHAYFNGCIDALADIPLTTEPDASFSAATQASLVRIPAGEVASYGEIAVLVGRPKAARAVGTACAANPLVLLRPCHRVLPAPQARASRASGVPLEVGKYVDGSERKHWLLRHESHARPGMRR